MKFSDPITAFVVSLPFREDRRQVLKAELDNAGIGYSIWWALSHTEGKIGLLETMKVLLQYCLDRGMDNVLILEDDARFLIPPGAFLKTVLPQLPDDYHLFYLGLNLTSQPTRYSDNLLKINSAYATHAIMYSRKGMEAVLKELQTNESGIPLDIMYAQRMHPQNASYASYPMLADQRPSFSNIDDTERDWGKLMNITYSMHTKKIFMEQPIPCRVEHTWNGIAPHVDTNRYEPQFPELWNKPCDCGKVKILQESGCGCEGGNKWQLVIVQNT